MEFFRKGGRMRGVVKGKGWLLLTRWMNLDSQKRQELNQLFTLNRRVMKAYLLKELGWRGYLVRRWLHRPLMAAALSMPVWAAFHLPVILLPAQRGRWSQNVAFLAAIAMFGAVMLKLYHWSRSIWPCAFLHLWWNLSNETVLGDVYGWTPGLFGGKFWIFNGEGLIGLIVMAPIAAWVIWRFRQEEEPHPA